MINALASTVFEVSWEVCNKCGGIHTVISSKANFMKKFYDSYFLIGPYFSENAKYVLEEIEPPIILREVFNELENKLGLRFHYGKWLIDGEPETILIEFDSLKSKINELRKFFWDKFRIDSLFARWDFDEPMLWAYSAGVFIDAYQKRTNKQGIVAHFHEWLSGFGLLYLKKYNKFVKTVFTTHATVLGRSISWGDNLYSKLKSIDFDSKAKELNVIEKATAERAACLNADVFTTVSDITAKECKFILGRYPDVITYNGFDTNKFPTIEETSLMHINARKKLREYLMMHFFGHYSFDLNHNLMFSIYGRPEVHNKGMDIFIKALGKLNEYLKNNPVRTVSVFFWPLQPNNGPKIELVKAKEEFISLKQFINRKFSTIQSLLLKSMIENKEIKLNESIKKKFELRARQSSFNLHKKSAPLLCAYNIGNEWNNDIIRLFYENKLTNKKEDPVKVVLYPEDLNSSNSLIDLNLYESIAGCHLTVLPSYYEPWGYTPLESIAVGVPTVTTDVTGFGDFMRNFVNDKGIFILNRYNKSDEDVVDELFEYLKRFVNLKHHERVENKIAAKELSFYADWSLLIKKYVDAHNLALTKKS